MVAAAEDMEAVEVAGGNSHTHHNHHSCCTCESCTNFGTCHPPPAPAPAPRRAAIPWSRASGRRDVRAARPRRAASTRRDGHQLCLGFTNFVNGRAPAPPPSHDSHCQLIVREVRSQYVVLHKRHRHKQVRVTSIGRVYQRVPSQSSSAQDRPKHRMHNTRRPLTARAR